MAGRKRFDIPRTLFGLACAGLSCSAGAQDDADVFDLHLHQLLHVEVTSVSRKPEEARHAPSAIYVISGEDLRRSGVTHIAEALRMVPGMHVARIDSNRWSIGTRGFAGQFANKLLVLIDGRSVYTPLFSGVFWDIQDTLLEDIERIEVIRGPGAVMWGANAVNGVINIITRKAADTTGNVVSLTTGSEDHGIAGFRHGAELSANSFGRVYVKSSQRDEQRMLEGGDNNDDWWLRQAGFRVDTSMRERESVTVQGDIYRGKSSIRAFLPSPFGPTAPTVLDHNDTDMRGYNLLGRWEGDIEDGGSVSVQAYYDRAVREVSGLIDIDFSTWDLEFQHIADLAGPHQLIWGGSFRLIQDEIGRTETFNYDPDKATRRRWGGFIQYDYAAIPDELNLIVGSKFEYNDYSHFEIQPAVRLLWRPDERHTVWSAISRAVRSADRSDQDLNLRLQALAPSAATFGLPGLVQLTPNKDHESEDLTAVEIGHRFRIRDNLSWDLATFYNNYEDHSAFLLSGTPFAVFTPTPHVVIPAISDNEQQIETWGFEWLLDWQPTDSWQLQGWYAWMDTDSEYGDNPNLISTAKSQEHANRRNLAFVRSRTNLEGSLEFDAMLRYVDAERNADIPSYTELDLRLGWHPQKDLEFSIVLQNIFDNEHREAGNNDVVQLAAGEIQRAIQLRMVWRPDF